MFDEGNLQLYKCIKIILILQILHFRILNKEAMYQEDTSLFTFITAIVNILFYRVFL